MCVCVRSLSLHLIWQMIFEGSHRCAGLNSLGGGIATLINESNVRSGRRKTTIRGSIMAQFEMNNLMLERIFVRLKNKGGSVKITYQNLTRMKSIAVNIFLNFHGKKKPPTTEVIFRIKSNNFHNRRISFCSIAILLFFFFGLLFPCLLA